MSFLNMMKQDYHLDDNQALTLKTDLKNLETFFDENFEDTPSFFQTFYDKFEKIIAPYGFIEGDAKQAEPLVSSLYSQGKFRILMSYVISAFYQSGGSSEIFADTYTQMQNHH
ncbi:hypothetical protein AAIR29_11740 [Psychrobacter sp. FBL11]|uniref:Uncharacterized protein n=1 Tax=Psychrobacter saeujeotis TaxID=3143436 RepID=A0ABU9XA54_9GAMM|nr:hypothetical protein [uncultured Psychrobacter sp.]